jgi:hypothetical protein
VRSSNFLQKIGIPHHEFWPMWMIILPALPAWIWYGIKAKSITYFTTVNGNLKNGGFCKESKIEMNALIPAQYLPKTVNVFIGDDANAVIEKMKQIGIAYPCIAKPEFGGRGRKVAVIADQFQLKNYLSTVGENCMVQEKNNFSIELGLFFYKMPNETTIHIPSLVRKEMMQVTGDGKSTIAQLMQASMRYQKQINRMQLTHASLLNSIPKKNEIILLEPIGNHCKGTIFRDAQSLINADLIKVFSGICAQINGMHYGRFDLKVASLEDLYKGTNICMMEMNGINADAAHIFDPEASLREAIAAQYRQAKICYNIALVQMKNGIQPASFRALWPDVKKFLGW